MRYATRENDETWEMTKRMSIGPFRSIQVSGATELKPTNSVVLEVRGQFDKARVTWESKERELEVQAPGLLFESLHFYIFLSYSITMDSMDTCWFFRSVTLTHQTSLQVLVRTRDRLVTSLKNEIELVAESWEVKRPGKLDVQDTLIG